MLEILGAISAIAGLVDLGSSLCISLYEKQQCLKDAGDSLKVVHNEVKSVSKSLEQLHQVLVDGETKGIQHTPIARQHLGEVVLKCQLVFARLTKVLKKFDNYTDLAKDAIEVSPILSIRARFRFMFEEKNIAKLRQDLETHKTSLALVLQLMIISCTVGIQDDTTKILKRLSGIEQEIQRRLIEMPDQTRDIKVAIPQAEEVKVEDAVKVAAKLLRDTVIRSMQPEADSSKLSAESLPAPADTAGNDIHQEAATRNVKTETSSDSVKQTSKEAATELSPQAVSPHRDQTPTSVNITEPQTTEGSDAPPPYQPSPTPHSSASTESLPCSTPPSRPRQPRSRLIIEGQTLFHAINTNNTKLVIRIMQAGAKATERKADGTSALQAAVAEKNEEMVNALLFFNADPNIGGGFHHLPIFEAIVAGCVNLVILLIESGADVHTEGLLAWVAETRSLTPALKTETLGYLIDKGADINAYSLKHGCIGTPLIVSITQYQWQPDITTFLLETAHADPNIVSKKTDVFDWQYSALYAAVWKKSSTTVEELFAHGALLESARRIMRFAAQQGDVAVMSCLLDHGADINCQATSIGNGGSTALAIAAENGNTEMVGLLLDRGADPSIRDRDMWCDSALDVAIKMQRHEVIDLILSHGTDEFENEEEI